MTKPGRLDWVPAAARRTKIAAFTREDPDPVASTVGTADDAVRGPLSWTGVGVFHRDAVWATASGCPTRHTLRRAEAAPQTRKLPPG